MPAFLDEITPRRRMGSIEPTGIEQQWVRLSHDPEANDAAPVDKKGAAPKNCARAPRNRPKAL